MIADYKYNKTIVRSIALGLFTIGLAACGDDNDADIDLPLEVLTQEFQVEVVNLTAGYI